MEISTDNKSRQRGDRKEEVNLLLIVILLMASAICAVALLSARLSIMALLCFMEENGYMLPTKKEMKTCIHKVAERAFQWWPTWKGRR